MNADFVPKSSWCRHHKHDHCAGYALNLRRERVICDCDCHDTKTLKAVIRYNVDGDPESPAFDAVAALEDRHGEEEVRLGTAATLGEAVALADQWARSRGYVVHAKGVTLKILDIHFTIDNRRKRRG